MRINAINTGNTTKLNKKSTEKTHNNVTSTPSFEGHKLINIFDVPHYAGLKGFVYELTNKQKVVIIPKKGPGATSVNTVVRTGSLNETDDVRGISHFMEHLAFDGSKGLRAGGFDKIATSKGADINAHTGSELTAYFFQVNGAKQKDYEELVAAHSTMVKYPRPSKSQFTKEQAVVIKEINQSKDRPEVKQYFNVLNNLLGVKTNAAHLTLGTEENITNITRKNILDYHKNSYTPDNMETYVVGDVSVNKMIKLIDKYFDTKDFRPAVKPKHFETLTPIEKTNMDFLASPQVELSEILLGFVGPENLNRKDTVALDTLLNVLTLDKNSRLNKKLLELNSEAGGGVEGIASHPKAPQGIFLETKVEPGSEQKALDAISESFKELKTDPVSEKELEIAKRIILDKFNQASENSEQLTGLMENFINSGGVDSYKNHVADINSITLGDLNRVADKYLNTKKASVSILQPESAQNTNITFTGKNLISTKFLKKIILPNNVKLVMNDNPYTIRTAGNLVLSSTVAKKPGVSEILAQMLDNSTSLHSDEEFSRMKAENAINFGISGAGRSLVVKFSCLKESLSTALDFAKEAIFSPKLDEKNFLKAKDEVTIALKSVPLTANDRLLETVYGKHALGESPRVLKQEIGKVTLEDVQNYYNEVIKNSYAKTIITGPISKVEGLTETIEKKLGDLANDFKPGIMKRPLFEGIKTPQVVVQAQKGLSQSHVIQLFHVDKMNIENIAAFKVLDSIIGGGLSARLFKDLREKQELAYQVGSGFLNYGDFGALKLVIKTDIKKGEEFTDNIEKSLAGFEKHMNLLKNKPVKASELADAKKMLRTDLSMSLEGAMGQTKTIAGQLDNGGAGYVNKLMTAIDKVTAQDVQRVAKEHLSKPPVISIL